jgi:hypothetical protein
MSEGSYYCQALMGDAPPPQVVERLYFNGAIDPFGRVAVVGDRRRRR